MGDTIALVTAVAAVTAAVLAAVAVALVVRMGRERAEGFARTDADAEALARLDAALAAANAGLSQLAAGMQGLAVQVSNGEVAARQRHEETMRGQEQTSAKADTLRRELSQRFDRNRDAVEGRLDTVRETIDRQLGAIRTDNERKLEAIRATVDEKLAQTLNDRLGASFKQVSDHLDAVSRGLGEMQSIASGVGDLKRVLSNVKTRGILGEVQLGAILGDMLAPEQYAENVATKPGSADRVEFAVRLPVAGGEPVWLPIDAKFPGDTYARLRDALDSGDTDAIAAARKALEQVIKQEAKDISRKYLSVPATTNFGILFLPFEGLYAEVVDRPGLLECLQRDYQVAVAGPSTMAVILNSLQMSYQTFAFQRRADEIQQVLAAVKAEFPKYQAELRRALKQIETAGRTVDGIINTRTNVIERKLRDVTALEDDTQASRLLGFEADADAVDAEGDEGADA